MHSVTGHGGHNRGAPRGHAGGGQPRGHGTHPRGPAPNPMMRPPGRGSPMHPTAAPIHRQPGHGASTAGHHAAPHTHPHTWTHAAHGPPHAAAHVHPGGAPAGHAAQKPSHKKAAIAAGAATGAVAGVAGATYFNSSNTIVENNNNEFETVEYPNGDEPDAYGYSDEYNVNDGYGYDGDRNEGQYYNNENYTGQDPAYNDYTGDSADVVSGGNGGPNSSGPAPFDGYNEPSNVATGTGNKENGASDDNDGCCGDCFEEDPLWQGFTFHRFGLIISAVFALIAVVTSGYLVVRHCTHYLKPWEQRHIIRVLFMVPIYAAVSFLSFYFYQHSVYYAVLRDCYEAFAIASFFALLCHYIAPDLHSQKDYFRGLKPRSWVLPLNWFKKCCGGEHGIWRTPRSGLTWFNIIWLGVFQYCFIRVATTLVALVTQLAGRYCLESLNPAFAHIWVSAYPEFRDEFPAYSEVFKVMVIEGACVTVAMYCLIQFYIQLRQDLSEHRPFLKILAIKLVIFLSFWQTLLISFLTSSGTIKSSRQLATPDIKIGIPSMLLCIEMALFSILHLFAFPWKEYDIHRSSIVAAESGPSFLPDKSSYKGGPLGIHALLDAFNPWDLIKAVVRGFRWLFVGRHKRELDVSYRDGTHLDSTRTGGVAADPAYRASLRGKASRYQPLGDEDDEQLLAYPPSNPVASDPYRPGPPNAAPVGTMGDSGDIGRARRYEYSDGADRLGAMHPAQGSAGRSRNDYAGQESGVIPAPLTQDTGYHGAMGGSVPRPGADGTGAEPGGQWDMWAGAAAHGVRPGEHDPSNRF